MELLNNGNAFADLLSRFDRSRLFSFGNSCSARDLVNFLLFGKSYALLYLSRCWSGCDRSCPPLLLSRSFDGKLFTPRSSGCRGLLDNSGTEDGVFLLRIAVRIEPSEPVGRLNSDLFLSENLLRVPATSNGLKSFGLFLLEN